MDHFNSVSLGWGAGAFPHLFLEAKEVSMLLECKVNFEFNGIKVNITKNSTLQVTWERVQSAIQHGSILAFGEEH